jgi:rubrerythrin
MVALEGTRTETNLRYAFAEVGRFDRHLLKQERAARLTGDREVAVLSRATAENGARVAAGHLDFLVADDAGVSPSETAAMIDGHTDMYAGMARTARDEGLEEIADWFETLAKAGRSRAHRFRRALHEYASKA